jgi:hypothetical protein
VLETEHYIKEKAYLDLSHKATIEEELQETLDKIRLDIEVILTANRITYKSLGGSQLAQHKVPNI